MIKLVELVGTWITD